jgi:hypothetical protein
MRRRQVHIRGIVEFRKVGTVAELAHGRWRVDGQDGRPVFVPVNDPTATAVQIGDLVEVEPSSPVSSLASPLAHENWAIVRRLEGS